MTNQWQPFLLVRPCGMHYAAQIYDDLRTAGLQPDARSAISAWREISRSLYFDQYGSLDQPGYLQDGAEAWLATTVALFGNQALCLEFENDATGDRKLEVASWLADYKQRFRRHRRAERSAIHLTITAGVKQWSIYFDCIHVPEPEPGRIAWELDTIRGHSSPMPGLGRPDGHLVFDELAYGLVGRARKAG